MVKVPWLHVFIAIVPATMIAALYFFDHNVAAQMAQQKEYNLQNPSAYHYDVFLLGIMADTAAKVPERLSIKELLVNNICVDRKPKKSRA